MRLFDRVVELRVGDTEITGLDIAFEIEKSLSPEPNSCYIDIYNLSEKNRQTLSKYQEVPVLLKAGYRGHVGILFKGDMISCAHTKEGPTWKTVLSSGDGAKAIQSARINKTFAKGTPIKTVIKEIAQQLKIPCDSALKQCESLDHKLSRGFIASGNPMDELCRVLRNYGYRASVQSNSLQVIKSGEALNGRAIELSYESGLMGTPELGSDGKLLIKTLLMPELFPGALVHVRSALFEGFASIQTVEFVGGNFGAEWTVNVACKKKRCIF